MAKLKPNEKRVQLSFQRPDDVSLYERLSAMAYDRRYDLSTFLILALHEAFEEQTMTEIPVRRSTFIPAEQIADFSADDPEVTFEITENATEPPLPPKIAPQSESTDDGYESTKAAIAQNNALYLKKAKPRKGAIPGAPDGILEGQDVGAPGKA